MQVEIGCRSLLEPFETTSFASLVDTVYADKVFSQARIQVPTVVPVRTLLEKLFLLHEEFHKPKDKVRVDRLSRHLYDVHQLIKAGVGNSLLENDDLYATIVNHRYAFSRIQGVNYNLHHPIHLNPLPPLAFEAVWKKDYAIMQEQMIYGTSPSYEDMSHEIKQFLTQLKIKNGNLTFNFPIPQ